MSIGGSLGGAFCRKSRTPETVFKTNYTSFHANKEGYFSESDLHAAATSTQPIKMVRFDFPKA